MHPQRQSLTAASMAEAMQGHVIAGDPATAPAGFTIDSRRVGEGDAFFAIEAARDGHGFAADAVAKGARVVVVSRYPDPAPLAPAAVIQVSETTRGLQVLGRTVRQRSGAKVIAITGSAGKTTTKETIAAFLEGRFAVVKNAGNLNNHLGLPLSLLELRHGADVAVMELGMNHAGEIRVLVGLAEPEVRVWTNVGDAHIGHFGTPDAIARAKAELLEGADANTVFVANADDARVMAYAARFPGRVVTFGLADTADVRAIDIRDRGLAGTEATVVTQTARQMVHVGLIGRANLSNVLCAAAVALEMGVPLDEICARASALAPARRRGEIRLLGSGVTVVDDSYNSSPAALTRALETLALEQQGRRHVAVLGEMLELGDQAVALHEACGRVAAASGLHLLVAVGGDAAAALARAAVAAGMAAEAVYHVRSSGEAATLMNRLVQAGDVVLVKGSRGVKTDLVVDQLAAVWA